jgi:hypothetical protein
MLSGETDWPHKRAHLLYAARPYVPKVHCHHYCGCQADPCLHFGFTTYVVFLKTKIIIEPTIDSLQRRTPITR